MSTHRLGNLLAKVHRPGKIPASEYLDEGEYPVIDQGQLPIAGYTSDHEIVVRAPLPITIFGDHTRAVKLAKEPFAYGADGTQLLYPNSEHIDPTFFYYAVKNIDLSNYFYARHFKFLKELEVNIPDEKGVQLRIASILSAYDDLIENNRRRIQLLEQAARLLYKEWFVHLRFPGHEHTQIIDGVPEGWEKKQVKDLLAKVKRPGKIQKEDYLSDGPIPCVDQSREFIGGYTDQIETMIDELPMIVFGDHTRILKFIDFPFACGADGTQLLAAHDPKISQEFFFFSLDAIDLSNYFYARHFKFLKDQHILRPTDVLIDQFTGVARPILKQVKLLREQNGELAKARDLLLPKLMNGEVAV